MRLELLSSIVVFGASFVSVLQRHSTSAAFTGLAITYSLQLTSLLQLLSQIGPYIESSFVSVERYV
jgi:hypothetical protein